MEIDTQRIIGEVAAKHGFALNPDDPLIALATVNSIVLQDIVRQAGEEISARIAAFNSAIDTLERRAGEAVGQQTAKLIRELRDQLVVQQGAPAIPQPSTAKESWPKLLYIALGLVAFVLGIVADRFLK